MTQTWVKISYEILIQVNLRKLSRIKYAPFDIFFSLEIIRYSSSKSLLEALNENFLSGN